MPEIGTALTAGTTLFGALNKEDAASSASQAQVDSSAATIEETRRQFDAMRALMSPYAAAGTNALNQQVGMLSAAGKLQAMRDIAGSDYFQYLMGQGENAILQNASATGGLRGGNVQAALGKFRPALLESLLDKQYTNLAGITSLGQNAAAGVGNAGMQTAAMIGKQNELMGAARAGGIIGSSNAISQGVGNLSGQLLSRFGGSAMPGATAAPATASYTPEYPGWETMIAQGWGV